MSDTRSITPKEANILLNYITLSAVMLDVLHELKDTSVYKQNLKYQIKNLERALNREKGDILTLFEICEEEFEQVIKCASELTVPLVKGVNPEHWQIVSHIREYLTDVDKYAFPISQIKSVIVSNRKNEG